MIDAVIAGERNVMTSITKGVLVGFFVFCSVMVLCLLGIFEF